MASPEPEDKTTAGPGPEGGSASAPRARRRRTAVFVIAVIVAVLVAAYVCGALYFQTRFMPGTLLGDEDVSGMSAEELARQTGEAVGAYSAAVEGDGLSLAIRGDEVGLSYDGAAYARAAIEQTQPWLWPLKVPQSRVLLVKRTVTLDEGKLEAVVKTAVAKANEGGTEPRDASVSYDSARQRFVPKQEQKGTKLSSGAVLKTVEQGMTALEPRIELGDAELKQPKVTSADQRLVSAAQDANRYLAESIPLTVDGKTVQVVGPARIAAWVSIGSDFKVSLDEDAVKNWCLGPVSRRFDTIGAKRVYKRKVGKKTKKITVSGGTYGWSTDSEKLAAKIADRLERGSGRKLAIPMKSKAAKWNPGGRDWKAYIDIDLTEQTARYYNAKGKIVWDSKIVSGNPSKNHATPTGVYVINNTMGRDQTLIGSDENGDGKPDYRTPVDYWMPFVGNLVALHDAPWRAAFGGSIYESNGSHGCVNLPPAKAKQLYGMVKPGVVVSCHK